MNEFDNGQNNQPQGSPIPPQQPYQQSPYQQQPYQQPIPPMQPPMAPVPPPGPQGGKGLAVASMVLGIISLVCFCWWYISVVAAIIGLILGIVSLRGQKPGRGMAIAGIVTSAIGLVLMVIFLILAAAGLAILGSMSDAAGFEDFMDYYYYYS